MLKISPVPTLVAVGDVAMDGLRRSRLPIPMRRILAQSKGHSKLTLSRIAGGNLSLQFSQVGF